MKEEKVEEVKPADKPRPSFIVRRNEFVPESQKSTTAKKEWTPKEFSPKTSGQGFNKGERQTFQDKGFNGKDKPKTERLVLKSNNPHILHRLLSLLLTTNALFQKRNNLAKSNMKKSTLSTSAHLLKIA